ncbi:Uncharacterised protein [Streptococcus pneumoniae]|nr:Uncharacterised protein [Streptococcus pneumoniae]
MGHVAGQDAGNSLFTIRFRQRKNSLHLHLSLGDGTRLVQTEHIHARQGLNRVHLLHQDLFQAQLNHCSQERSNGQKGNSLRQHSQKSCRRVYNG